MTFTSRFYLFITLLLSAPPLYALESYINMEGFVYSAPVPYKAFVGDWSSDFQTGDSALGYSWLEAGVHNGHWGIALVQQQYAQVRFSNDTAELYYLTENKLPITPNRTYDIDLMVNSFSSEGVRLFHRHQPFPTLSLQMGANILKGDELQVGRIHGNITSINDRDYNFDNIQLDYHYSEDKLFNNNPEAPQGNGLALDFAAHWKINTSNELSVNLRNLGGFIKWKQSPYTIGTIESDNKTYDSEGNVTVSPSLNGWNLSENYRQQLPLLWQGEFLHHYNLQSRLHAHIMGSEVEDFYSLGYSFRIRGNQWLKLLYTLNSNSLITSYQNNWLNLQLQFDPGSLSDSHTLGLAVQAHYGF